MQIYRSRKEPGALGEGEKLRVIGHRHHGGWRRPPPRGEDKFAVNCTHAF